MLTEGNMTIIYIIGYVKKRKLKQWWSTIPPISTNQAITSHFNSLHTKNGDMTYAIGNSDLGLGQAQQCLRNCH